MRIAGVAVLLAAVTVAGVLVAQRWPSRAPQLDCDPSQVHLDDAGIAHCGPGRPLSAAQVLTAGGKLDLNRASEDDLAVVPGVGKGLARALVNERTRLGGFKSWDEVDRVSGVGDAKLEALKATTEIR